VPSGWRAGTLGALRSTVGSVEIDAQDAVSRRRSKGTNKRYFIVPTAYERFTLMQEKQQGSDLEGRIAGWLGAAVWSAVADPLHCWGAVPAATVAVMVRDVSAYCGEDGVAVTVTVMV